jgi:hypothetical protein
MDRDGVLAILQHYFKEEVKTGWALLAVAFLALLAGAWLWRSQSAFRHALWPLAGLALLQMAVGGVLVLTTPPRVAALQAQLDQAPAAFKDQEGQRVARELDAFRLYKLAEIALILAAMGLALFLPQNTVARGWALGLLLQVALLLAAALVAEQRAETYLDAIRRL